jgi:hypothetical protein
MAQPTIRHASLLILVALSACARLPDAAEAEKAFSSMCSGLSVSHATLLVTEMGAVTYKVAFRTDSNDRNAHLLYFYNSPKKWVIPDPDMKTLELMPSVRCIGEQTAP